MFVGYSTTRDVILDKQVAVIQENRGDAAANAQTEYTLSPGDVFRGTLASDADGDWIRLNLTGGTTYNITLDGIDAAHLALFDRTEKEIIPDVYSPAGSSLVYRPTDSGSYYIRVSDGLGAFRDYEVSLSENTLAEGTHDEIADYLTDGYQLWFGDVRQAFAVAPGGTLSANITALTDGGQQLARWALESWSYVSGIQFEFVDHDDAHIMFDDELGGGSAFSITQGGIIISSHVNVGKEYLISGASIGSDAFFTYIHEIGHALGLGHAGPYNGFGDYGTDNVFLNDSTQVTVMSYFFQDENMYIDASNAFPVTPMVADIIAIHDLYGAPADINLGDTVYGYRTNVDGYLGEVFRRWAGEDDTSFEEPIALTLYDNGGNDTLDLRTDTADQRIDLEPEGISDVYGLTGNLIIARDVLIENVIAGSGDDVLFGNALANELQGRGGTDALWGRGGDDILEGGPGADRLHGGAGTDWVSYRASNAPVTLDLAAGTVTGGHAEGDVMTGIEGVIGSEYEDVLLGNGASNHLEGGAGADRLDGRGGEDWVSYRGSDAGVHVRLDDNTVAGAHADGDVIVNFENVTGSGHADILTGAAGANRLDGGAADDMLEGGGGADELVGGAGEDIASYEHSGAGVVVRLHALTARGGDAEGDVFGSRVTLSYTDRAGVTRVEVVPDIEHLRGSVYADTLAGDSRANQLYGGPGADRLYGGPGGGDDVLWGGPGADALYGGIGNDVLEGGADADTLRGGPGADTASYWYSAAAVVVRLSDGVTSGGHAEGDVIADTENITGSAYEDVLTGDDGANVLEGGPGADRLDGGGGIDWVSYLRSDAGVVVRLREGTGERGHAEGDVIAGVENVTGSAYNDELVGDYDANHLVGGEGNDGLWGSRGDDVLEGGAGADRLFGGAGVDRASYLGSDAGVTVNLKEGAAEGGHAGGDEFTEIENVVGSAYRDVLVGDDGVNHLEGAGVDDDLKGAGGNDLLSGGLGNDLLYGGESDDELRGSKGNDRLFGEVGSDILYGDEGDDALRGGVGIDQLFGGIGDDWLYGDDGDDTLLGGDGDDRLYGNAGADRLDGGNGSDWMSYLGSDTAVSVNLVDGTGTGGDAQGDEITGIENLAGSAYADVLIGDAAANTLHGLAGADELQGNGGNDVLEGGAGADRLDGGAGIDQLSYRGSDEGVTVRLNSGYANHGHAVGDVIIDIENVNGSDYNDVLEGDGAANQLAGGKGDDTLIGNGGADRLDGGHGNDEIDYTASGAGVRVDLEQGAGSGGYAEGDIIINVENVTGSGHSDVLTGDGGANHLFGWTGDDEIYGGPGDDLLVGGPGADRIEGGAGYDHVFYTESDTGVTIDLSAATAEGGDAQGDVISGVEQITGSFYSDVLVGDNYVNTLSGDHGDDELFGNGGNDTLSGDEGHDKVHGDAGNDWLEGFSGDDELYGGAGDDWLEGYTGADRLVGGAGDDELFGSAAFLSEEDSDGSVDVFVFADGNGDDIIYGFADNEDQLDLSAFNLSGFDALDLSTSEFAGGTIIDLSTHGGGTILLVDIDIASLDATDFLF